MVALLLTGVGDAQTRLTLEQAQADAARAASEIARLEPASHAFYTSAVVDLREHILTDLRSTLLLLFAAAGMLLLIACANVSTLLLARSLARAREAVSRARELAHPFSVAHALLFETVVHTLRRDLPAQRARAAEVIALAEAHGFPFWLGVAQTFHAAARVAAGETEAVADMRAGFALSAESGSRGGAPASLAQLAQAYLSAKQLEQNRCFRANSPLERGFALRCPFR